MLIGIDASRATARERTGTENYSLYLIRALLNLQGTHCTRHRFRLYFNKAPAEDLFVRDERVEWRVIPCPRLWTHARLAWEVIRHPPDVLFVPSHVLPLLHPRHCVVTVHDLGYLHYPQAHTRWSRWYLDWSTRFNARVAEYIIVDSAATRRDLIAFYRTKANKIALAYPAGAESFAPVRDPATLQSIRQRYATGESYFLFLGTLQPRKNLATLLRAFASLVAKRAIAADVRLVIAGKRGWLYEGILAVVQELGLQERVVFTGYVAQEDLPGLLSGALAFVLPSWYEGFGLPLLEAMACETPVICSNVSSLPEVAGDAALMFEPGDIDALARAMERVAHDVDYSRQLITRGRERVRAFSWERCAQQVLQVLESTLQCCRVGAEDAAEEAEDSREH